jgi:hypothetical protein
MKLFTGLGRQPTPHVYINFWGSGVNGNPPTGKPKWSLAGTLGFVVFCPKSIVSANCEQLVNLNRERQGTLSGHLPSLDPRGFLV